MIQTCQPEIAFTGWAHWDNNNGEAEAMRQMHRRVVRKRIGVSQDGRWGVAQVLRACAGRKGRTKSGTRSTADNQGVMSLVRLHLLLLKLPKLPFFHPVLHKRATAPNTTVKCQMATGQAHQSRLGWWPELAPC